jgi:hypothetical protein
MRPWNRSGHPVRCRPDEEDEMSCEHLVCAYCSGPVSEGRCSVCRAGRARVHYHYSALSPALIVVVMALLLALIVLADRFSA